MTEHIREQKKKEITIRSYQSPVLPPSSLYKSTTPQSLPIPPPPPPTPPSFNNTMGIEFLVQIRQSNKCWSVRDDEIFNLHLESGVGPQVSIPCLLQGTSHICWFHLPKQFTRKNKEPRNVSQLDSINL